MTPRAEQTWKVLDLLNWTKQHLTRSGLDSPRLAAEVLLAHSLGCGRIDLYTRYDHQPAAEELATFRGLVARAAKREPVAYLVGQKEFYSLSFDVTPAVLIPRPETESLVTEAIGHLRGLPGPGRMWDVCTGSGCVAIAVARQVEGVSVLATDVSSEALAVATRNAEKHGVSDRVQFHEADLLSLPPGTGDATTFDAITANPPYVAAGDEVAPEVAYEPREALVAGPDGLKFSKGIIADAPEFLKAGGIFALEFGRGQADEIRDLIIQTGSFTEPRILRDHQGIERIAVASKCD